MKIYPKIAQMAGQFAAARVPADLHEAAVNHAVIKLYQEENYEDIVAAEAELQSLPPEKLAELSSYILAWRLPPESLASWGTQSVLREVAQYLNPPSEEQVEALEKETQALKDNCQCAACQLKRALANGGMAGIIGAALRRSPEAREHIEKMRALMASEPVTADLAKLGIELTLRGDLVEISSEPSRSHGEALAAVTKVLEAHAQDLFAGSRSVH